MTRSTRTSFARCGCGTSGLADGALTPGSTWSRRTTTDSSGRSRRRLTTLLTRSPNRMWTPSYRSPGARVLVPSADRDDQPHWAHRQAHDRGAGEASKRSRSRSSWKPPRSSGPTRPPICVRADCRRNDQLAVATPGRSDKRRREGLSPGRPWSVDHGVRHR